MIARRSHALSETNKWKNQWQLDCDSAHQDDQSVPLDETLIAFDKLVQAVKVRCIAGSNYTYDRNFLAH